MRFKKGKNRKGWERAEAGLTVMAGAAGPEEPSVAFFCPSCGFRIKELMGLPTRKKWEEVYWIPIPKKKTGLGPLSLRKGERGLESLVFKRRSWAGLFSRGWKRSGVSPWPCAAAPSRPQPAAGAAPCGRCLGAGPGSWEEGTRAGEPKAGPLLLRHLLLLPFLLPPPLPLPAAHPLPGPQFSS